MPRKEDIAKYLADKRRYAGEKVPSMTRRRLGHDYEARRMYLITVTVEGRRPLFGYLDGGPLVPHGAEGAPHIVLSPLGRAAEERMLILAPWEHHNERRTIRRDQCLTLNDMAAMLCRGG